MGEPPPAPPPPEGAFGAGPLGGFGLFGPLGGFGLLGPLGGVGVSGLAGGVGLFGPLGGLGSFGPLGLLGFGSLGAGPFLSLGRRGLAGPFPGGFGAFGLLGGLLGPFGSFGEGLPGCCGFCMLAEKIRAAPAPGHASAPAASNAADHPILFTFTIVSSQF
ncbi:MAG TPA: hypothetical protein VFE02_14180 [Candidatus Acidoferrales bacterium]|nr:hypothetical protein [Candidatus Acidoferrales bacterium]